MYIISLLITQNPPPPAAELREGRIGPLGDGIYIGHSERLSVRFGVVCELGVQPGDEGQWSVSLARSSPELPTEEGRYVDVDELDSQAIQVAPASSTWIAPRSVLVPFDVELELEGLSVLEDYDELFWVVATSPSGEMTAPVPRAVMVRRLS